MTVAIYARISEDRAGEAAGVTRQLADARALAATRGWHVVAEHVDNHMSALKGGRRPGYTALMAAVDAGELTRIIVFHTSRLWRNRRERADGIDRLRAARVSIVACKGPELDMSTAYGRGLAGLVGEFDTLESEVKGERIARAAQARAEQGLNHGGRRCFGYTKDGLHIDPGEAKEVARAADQLLAGVPLARIVRDLNNRGVPTVGGGLWAPAILRDMLIRPRLAGLSAYKGAIVGKGRWPAILTPEQHHALVALIKDPARRSSTGNRAAYLLSGIARCAVCGERITSHGVKKYQTNGVVSRRHMYRCRTNGCVGRRRDWIDEWVTSVILARLEQADAARLLVDDERPDLAALSTEAETIRVRLDEAAAAFADGAIDASQLRTATGRLRERLAAIEAAQQHTSRAPVLRELVEADDARAAWDRLSLDRQRAVVQCLVDVRIRPGGGGRRVFDPQYVEITPKV